MLDAQSNLFPSDHLYETSNNHKPRRQLTWLLTSFVFSIEALAIFGTGFLLQKLTSAQLGVIQPLELSFAYCFVVILMDGVAISSFERRPQTALRAVTAVFICTFAIHASLILTSAWGAATLATWLAVAAAGVTILGNGARDMMQRLPAVWPLPSRALVLGNGPWALNFARDNRLAGARAAFDVVGIVDEPDGTTPRDGLNGLASRVVAEKVTDVFVALPVSAAERIRDILAALRFLPVTVRLAPEHLPLLRIPGVDVGAVRSMPVLSRPPFSPVGLSIKRGMDVAGAVSLIVLLLPLFAVLAILIKIDSPGPVLFRQTRMGQFGSSSHHPSV